MDKIFFLSLQFQHRSIERAMKNVFVKVIERGKFILDEEVTLFEQEFAAFQKAKYAVGVANGHDAILISLKALGIGRGDEVIVPSHTCFATWLAVANAGATPVPVEVDPATFNINPARIENVLTDKTKAIVPVHLYGFPCCMDEIMTIAKKNKLWVVEDNAQAQGAQYKNRMTGSWGDCNATSFYPTKNLGALGDGGAITTHRKELANFAKQFRNYGSAHKDVHTLLGINSRLDELQAAWLRIKLKKVNEWNNARKQNAELYREWLGNVAPIQLPPTENKLAKPTFHLFVIKTERRDALKKQLERKGIETAIHYPTPVHLQKAFDYLNYKKNSLPIAEKLSQTILSLPIGQGLKEKEIERVCVAIKNFFN